MAHSKDHPAALRQRTWLADAMANFSPRSGAGDDYCKGLVVGAVAGLMAEGMPFAEALGHAADCLPDNHRPLTDAVWPPTWERGKHGGCNGAPAADEALDGEGLRTAVGAWLKGAQARVDEQYGTGYGRKTLSVTWGARYARVRCDPNNGVFAFIDQNGDVLKPASASRPARHARGNVFDEHGGLAGVGPYGPAYLK